MKILVTAGGTQEPIDPVRSIANRSRGQTGYEISRGLLREGHEVTLLQSRNSPFLGGGATRTIAYMTTADLRSALESELQHTAYDAVVHSAAVSDYRLQSMEAEDGGSLDFSGKIQHEGPIILRLVPQEKLLKSIRTWAKKPSFFLVSFKLTAGEKSKLKLENYDSDWVIHNALENVHGEQHYGTIYERSEKGAAYTPLTSFSTKQGLIHLLIQKLETLSLSKPTSTGPRGGA